MATVIATRKVAGGDIEQRICPSCQHAYWTKSATPRFQCADCDPQIEDRENRGIGRNYDRKHSDRQYHGHYQE